jgi:hypothetical protein
MKGARLVRQPLNLTFKRCDVSSVAIFGEKVTELGGFRVVPWLVSATERSVLNGVKGVLK